MNRFAQNTDVSTEKSRAEIERLITRYGATQTAFFNEPGRAMVLFEAKGRRVFFTLPLPRKTEERFQRPPKHNRQRSPAQIDALWEQACRQSWRALALVIKAKLEAVASGITTFEDEFMAHIVMPDGKTVGEHVRPTIAAAYDSKRLLPFFPGVKH